MLNFAQLDIHDLDRRRWFNDRDAVVDCSLFIFPEQRLRRRGHRSFKNVDFLGGSPFDRYHLPQ